MSIFFPKFSRSMHGVFKGYAPSASTPVSGVDGDCAVAIRCSLSLWTYFYALMKPLLSDKFLFLCSKKKIPPHLSPDTNFPKCAVILKKFQKISSKKKKPAEAAKCFNGPLSVSIQIVPGMRGIAPAALSGAWTHWYGP